MRESDYAEEGNRGVMAKLLKVELPCPCCPPHRGENEGRRPRHGAGRPKYKNRSEANRRRG